MVDQSIVCQTGLSPGTPNGAPFSCLVGGGRGGEEAKWGVGRSGVVQIERLTEKVKGRERQLDRQTDGEMGTNKNNTGQKMRVDRQREGGSNE